jgi:hypothetical protein
VRSWEKVAWTRVGGRGASDVVDSETSDGERAGVLGGMVRAWEAV